MPVESGNAQARKGFDALQRILAEQKPEAIYFATDAGKRTAFMFKSMNDLSELPAIAEPWFLALNASMEVAPAMTPADLMKAGPAIGQAVKNYGG
jgi:hypothetical protein